MHRTHSPRASRNLLAALVLAFGLAGCDTGLDIFDKLDFLTPPKKPVPGDRRAVFPEGVPGIEYGAPPPQPTNTNIPINPAAPATTTEQTPTPRPQTTARRKSSDPWDGAR
jgi:hypothetical protein